MELNKQQEEFIRTFMANIETAINNLSSNKDNNTTEVLTKQGNSDEEKETIKDLCNEIDLFHQKKKELKEMKADDPKYTESEWLKNEIVSSVNEVFSQKNKRDLTAEEQGEILSGVKEIFEESTNVLISKIAGNKEEQEP